MKSRVRNTQHETAISAMQHYFRTAFEGAGLHWSEDNDEEVAKICDDLVDAARGDDD